MLWPEVCRNLTLFLPTSNDSWWLYRTSLPWTTRIELDLPFGGCLDWDSSALSMLSGTRKESPERFLFFFISPSQCWVVLCYTRQTHSRCNQKLCNLQSQCCYCWMLASSINSQSMRWLWTTPRRVLTGTTKKNYSQSGSLPSSLRFSPGW